MAIYYELSKIVPPSLPCITHQVGLFERIPEYRMAVARHRYTSDTKLLGNSDPIAELRKLYRRRL